MSPQNSPDAETEETRKAFGDVVTTTEPARREPNGISGRQKKILHKSDMHMCVRTRSRADTHRAMMNPKAWNKRLT